MPFSRLIPCLLILMLAACGGGSDAESTLRGRFVDSPVEGLGYSTPTHGGVTGPDGSFLYEAGEMVTFFVGATRLGASVPAAASMTPADLVPGVELPTTASAVNRFFADYTGETLTVQGRRQHELLNILSLLHSLDGDKNPTNGVLIDGRIAALVTKQIDLTHRPGVDAPGHRDVRRLLYQAFNLGYMASARQVLPLAALDHFVSERGIAMPFLRARSEVDTDASGAPDDISLTILDARRWPVGWARDTTGDGVAETTGTSQFSPFADLLRTGFDSDGNGFANSIETFTVDIHGNRTIESLDSNVDTTPDRINTLIYDAEGNLTRVEEDDDANGSPERITAYTYDSGRRIRAEFDTDGNGGADRIITYEYDANGYVTVESEDSDVDGTPDRIQTSTYDAQGNRTRYEDDTDGDGGPNRVITYAHNANGNVVSRGEDADGDGTIDATRTFAYNAAGFPTRYEEDNDADGAADRIDTWVYDADGNLTSRTEDTNGDGTPESVFTYTYDDAGNNTGYEEETDVDVTPDRIDVYTYDADGNRTLEEIDADGDGTLDEIRTHEYLRANFLGIGLSLPPG
ncbi:MAG: hypothetical protein ACYTF9_08630 [Planctomycetota bacterium]|jgi:YD repeat-containing protein